MNSNQQPNFDHFLNHKLNPAQREAVIHQQGSLLIVAGAGSGKTRVITARIAHLLLNHKALPSSIIALTFTNKAALEMKERIQHFLDQQQQELPFVGTFHSFCLRILKKNSELLENPFFSILDEDDQQKILQGIITKGGLTKKITAKQLAYQISHIKNQSIDPANHDFFSLNPLVRDAYLLYEQEKRASKCLDFDDLLLEVVKIFQKNPTFKKSFQEQTRHILVDEYQDTNVVQHELLKQMALAQKNKLAIDSLCAVGDEDQSIYSWRGATVTNIMNFAKDFAGTTIIKIEQNYRSVQPILDVANQVIQNNSNRNPKKLWSEKKGSDRIRTLCFLSEYQEADSIAQFLKQASKKQKLNQIALLYRTHFQSRALEEALLKHSIPYKIIGGIQFYERKEIKDILAYLKLIINPFDRASFFRVINCPLRGLGNKFEEQFYARWHPELFATFIDVAHAMINDGEITGTKKDAVLEFLNIFSTLDHTQKPSTAVEHVIIATNYFRYLKDTYDQEEALGKIENVKELLQAINHLESQKITTIVDFLDEVALMQAQIQSESNEKDPVFLMTLHAAKGLEFDTVIVTGLEEGLLPSSRSLTLEESVEEERRLFYVGITRAQERLLLTYSRYRYTFGTMTDQRPSRFVQEITSAQIPAFDCSYWNQQQVTDFYTNWLNPKSARAAEPKIAFQPSVSSKKEVAKPAQLWKKNQPVSHQKFGVGIVQDIELRGNGVTYLQVKFKTGVKKIEAHFVTTS